MDFKTKFDMYTELINTELQQMIEVKDNPQATIYKAMNYSLMAGGKRIRPILTLAVCEMFGGNMHDALRFGTAIECIHTYSLIHDDLPCMDNDNLRRGIPTCHKKFDEATAVLAGDALLNFAFERMTDMGLYENIDSVTSMRIIKFIANSAGTEGMIGGQIIDMENEDNPDADENSITYMHTRKTGALITAAVMTGAMIAGAKENDLKKVIEFSHNLGLAFQIKDDLLDCNGNEEVLGKSVGKDSENKKVTYATILGVDEAEKKLAEHTDKAINALSNFGTEGSFLTELALYLLKREK